VAACCCSSQTRDAQVMQSEGAAIVRTLTASYCRIFLYHSIRCCKKGFVCTNGECGPALPDTATTAAAAPTVAAAAPAAAAGAAAAAAAAVAAGEERKERMVVGASEAPPENARLPILQDVSLTQRQDRRSSGSAFGFLDVDALDEPPSGQCGPGQARVTRSGWRQEARQGCCNLESVCGGTCCPRPDNVCVAETQTCCKAGCAMKGAPDGCCPPERKCGEGVCCPKGQSCWRGAQCEDATRLRLLSGCSPEQLVGAARVARALRVLIHLGRTLWRRVGGPGWRLYHIDEHLQCRWAAGTPSPPPRLSKCRTAALPTL
jgi:hypothetical protein